MNSSKYDDKFTGGCTLTPATIAYLETVTANPTVSARTDKQGRTRVFVSYAGKVYGAGGRVYNRMFTRMIGIANEGRSAYRIQLEAMVIMALGATNRHALNWLKGKI